MGRLDNILSKGNNKRYSECSKRPSGFSAENSFKAQTDESNRVVVRIVLVRNDGGLD